MTGDLRGRTEQCRKPGKERTDVALLLQVIRDVPLLISSTLIPRARVSITPIKFSPQELIILHGIISPA